MSRTGAPPEMSADYELHLRRQVKAELRARMKALRAQLPAAARAARSAALCARVGTLAAWQGARTVAGFVALRGEVDVASLLAAARADGKRVVLPRVGEGDALTFHLGEALVASAFGVLEPAADAPTATPDLVLVPGLAFDERGHRLGYGAGYYDRFLGALHPATIGVCFDFQLVPELPDTPGDVAVDRVATDARVLEL